MTFIIYEPASKDICFVNKRTKVINAYDSPHKRKYKESFNAWVVLVASFKIGGPQSITKSTDARILLRYVYY